MKSNTATYRDKSMTPKVDGQNIKTEERVHAAHIFPFVLVGVET